VSSEVVLVAAALEGLGWMSGGKRCADAIAVAKKARGGSARRDLTYIERVASTLSV
jgi:hypothetical protein